MTALDGIVRRGADAYPDKVAIIDDATTWTWAEFDRQVTRVASALRAFGVPRGGRVAAAGFNSAAYFALYFGAARAEAVLCPLNYISAEDELRYLLADFSPQLILAEEWIRGRLESARSAANLDAPVVPFNGPGAEWDLRVATAGLSEALGDPDPDSSHLVMYTSGTTGRPKGVVHTQRAHYLDGLMASIAFRTRDSDRYLVHAPSFHCACWDHAKMYLIADGSVRLLPRFDAGQALKAIAKDAVTAFFGVPAVLRTLLSHPDWAATDKSSLRTVIYGGALGETDVLFELSRSLGHAVAITQIYGLTEGGPVVAVLPPETASHKPGPIGRPIPGVEMRLVDPATGAPVEAGGIGEIVVRSPSIMRGYWGNPTATAAAIRDGWLHTGDLGTRDADGDFLIVDRLKDMIRTGGENVYAAEVERVLMSHPDVLEAAVIGLPDPRWDERVVAVVVRAEGGDPTPGDVIAHCRDRLAPYKVPKNVEFVSDLPRTGLGKIAKQELRKMLVNPSPGSPG